MKKLFLKLVRGLPIKYQVSLLGWYDDYLNKQICKKLESPRLAQNRWRYRIIKFFTPWIVRVGDLEKHYPKSPACHVTDVAENPFEALAHIVTKK